MIIKEKYLSNIGPFDDADLLNKIIILGHKNPDVDSIVSGYLLEKLLTKKGYNVQFIIPDKKLDQDTIDICLKNGLNPFDYQKDLPKESHKYILVDHNERDIRGKIVGIIDHHPALNKVNMINYYNKEISSTSCFITQGNEQYFSDNDLKLACVAAMVDTASFHSTKGRKEDYDWVRQVCRKHNINYEQIYLDGLCLTDLTDYQLSSLNGLKSYNVENFKFEASYVQIIFNKENEIIIYKIIDYLKKYIVDKCLDCFCFIVHDMKHFRSNAYIIFDNDIKVIEYPKYTSRGNTIIPDRKSVV